MRPSPSWLELRRDCGAEVVVQAGPMSESLPAPAPGCRVGPQPFLPVRADARPTLSAEDVLATLVWEFPPP